MKKRLITILLSLAMVICLMPVASGVVFADSTAATWVTSEADVQATLGYSGALAATYDGTNHNPRVKTKVNGTEADSGVSMTYTYAPYNSSGTLESAGGASTYSELTEMTNAGQYVITATPDGATYTGDSLSVTLTISQYNLSSATLTVPTLSDADSVDDVIAKTTFSGALTANIKNDISLAAFSVTDNATTLSFSAKTTNVFGTQEKPATVYVGLVSKSTTKPNEYQYTGSEIKPYAISDFEVKDKNSSVISSANLALEYPSSDYVNAGSVKVKIKPATGVKYSGELEQIYSITRADVSSESVYNASSKGESLVWVNDIETKIPKDATTTTVTVTQKKGSTWETVPTSAYTVNVTGSGTEGGTATVNVAFNSSSNFTGTISKTATVAAAGKTLSSGYTLTTTPASAVVFNGRSQALAASKIIVKDSGSNTLAAANYDVYYRPISPAGDDVTAPIKAGTYKVVVKGKGDYAGEIESVNTDVTITTARLYNVGATSTFATTYTSSLPTLAANTDLKLSVNGTALVAGTDYTVDTKYYTSKTTSSAVSTKPTTIGTYYIRVYGNTPNFATDTTSTSAAETFWLAVSLGNNSLSKGTISFNNTYNSYSYRTYAYTDYAVASGTYKGYYYLPTVAITIDNQTVPSSYYTVKWEYYNGTSFVSGSTYSDSTYFKKTGVYRVTLTAATGNAGGFKDSITAYYSVGGQTDISKFTFTLSKTSDKAATSVTGPTVSGLKSGGTVYAYALTLGTDYSVTYKVPGASTNTAYSGATTFKTQGEYVYTATAATKGAFKGSVTATYTFGVADTKKMSEAKVTLSKTSLDFTGSSIAKSAFPTVSTVYYSNTKLTTAMYTVKYMDGNTTTAKEITNITKPGTYYVRVSAVAGNGYTGYVDVPFTVKGVAQTISVEQEDYTVYKNSSQFDIYAYCGTSTLKYSSSNSNVAEVTSSGVVIPGEYVGYTVITITAPANGKYEATEKRVIVNVKPTKQVVSATSPAKGQVKFKITQQKNADKYQIRYSYLDSKVKKNYKSTTVAKFSSYTSTYKTKLIKKSTAIKSGKYLYYKARAVWTDAYGETHYGAWSTAKKVKIK